jgi:purine-binding chemotaxis protein CheW
VSRGSGLGAPPRRSGGGGRKTPPQAAAEPVRLPASGLAHEILAAAEGLAMPGPDAPAVSSAAPAEPARLAETATLAEAATLAEPATLTEAGGDEGPIFSFADSLGAPPAHPGKMPAERPESWVMFELAGELYALPVARIQEIRRAHAITRVPHAPGPVRGITSLRGKVLVIVDLRQRLGMPPAEVDPRSRILVVSSRERSLGLLVDAAHQVISLLASRIDPPPADVMTERSTFLSGVAQLDQGLVFVLDLDQLLLVREVEEPSPAVPRRRTV